MSRHSKRMGDTSGLLLENAPIVPTSQALHRKRQIVADLCRLLGSELKKSHGAAPSANGSSLNGSSNGAPSSDEVHADLPHLSPRMRQTLDALLAGDSEKQIARRLALSRHTVHVYVKAIYKGFAVNSRGELLARFVRGSRSGAPVDRPA